MPTILTVSDLFQPQSSGIGLNGAVPLSPPIGTWLYYAMSAADTVGLPTTAWEPGGPEREILAIDSVLMSRSDVIISTFAQSAFLDSAASGTVTYQALNGQFVTIYVTPDPSVPSQNPTGALGWLDLTMQSVYGTTRLTASFASGQLAIANTGSTTIGPYPVGGYHVANTNSKPATYSNTSSFSIPSSIIAANGGIVTGVTPGLARTIINTMAPHGLAPGNIVYIIIPSSAGVSGLFGVFAAVLSVTTNTFQAQVTSSGTYTSGGQVYLCTQTTMQADVLGTGSNAGPGTVTTAITSNVGVFVSNPTAWSGANWESNRAAVTRTRNSLAAPSPNGPAQAYEYIAETATQLLAFPLTNGPVVATETANPVTGIVTTVVASTTPVSAVLGAAVTPGCSQLPVSGATNANPIVITTAGNHGLLTGYFASISGVLGNTAANGTFPVTFLSATTFSIPIAGNGAYLGGGAVEGGDLGLIDQLIQRTCVPDGIQGAVTVSALAFPVTVVGTAVVPQANVQQYALLWKSFLVTYLQSLDIGGDSPVFAVVYDGIVGALEQAGVVVPGAASYVIALQNLTVNGGQVDVPFISSLYQAVLSPASSITVVGA